MQPFVTQQTLWLGLNGETWAIVAATALGPVIAILITRWRDWVRETRNRRMHVFRVLMATRRQAITPDHVGAINLIEIEFYGIRPIEDAWKAYHHHLNSSPPGRPMTFDEQRAFEEGRNNLLAKLLFAISKFLGFKMSDLDLSKGGYSPEGWRYRDDRLSAILEFAKEMATGNRGLPIESMPSSPPASTILQPPSP